MRKELKILFKDFLDVETQKSIYIGKEKRSNFESEFKDESFDGMEYSPDAIIIDHIFEPKEYGNFMIEEYSFSFLKWKEKWYVSAWFHSHYENKKELFESLKERLSSSLIFKDIEIISMKSYSESNFISFKCSLKNKKINNINIKEEKFYHLLMRDLKKSKRINIKLSKDIIKLEKIIGDYYINQKYSKRLEVLLLLDIDKESSITKDSLELIELNYNY